MENVAKANARLAQTESERINELRANPEHFYLNYLNNYLTVQRIADDYGIALELALELIKKGREIQNGK